MRKNFTRLFNLVIFLCTLFATGKSYSRCTSNQVMGILPGADTSNCFGENNNCLKIGRNIWESVEKRSSTLVVSPSMDDLYMSGDTFEYNYPVFVIRFKNDITFNQSGDLYVTLKDSTEPALVFKITNVEVDEINNTITVNDEYPTDGLLVLNTTYIVTINSGIIMGNGLALDEINGASREEAIINMEQLASGMYIESFIADYTIIK